MAKVFDSIVLGGGAAGIAAAVCAAEKGRKTLLIEKGPRLGRKISASGNGRCNLMNLGAFRYFGDSSFAHQILTRCAPAEIQAFFHRYGLMLTEENDHRVYPVTLNSVSVLNALKYALELNHVDVLLNGDIQVVNRTDDGFLCRSSDGAVFRTSRLIVCTGGAAQMKLGGSMDGYHLLQSFGHRLEPVFPALVPVLTDGRSVSGLSGLRVRGTVSLFDASVLLHRENGEILFTDTGLSGICVMQCSRFIHGGEGLHVELDFLSSVFPEPRDALSELLGKRKLFGSASPVALLEGVLLPKLAFAVMKQAGIPLRGETASDLSDADLQRIVDTGYHYRCEVLGTRSLEDAQVTAGGIRCDEFDPDTLESRLVPNLFAAGEVLNVDGDCGGFNLMFAFASGMLAGGFRTDRIPEGK